MALWQFTMCLCGWTTTFTFIGRLFVSNMMYIVIYIILLALAQHLCKWTTQPQHLHLYNVRLCQIWCSLQCCALLAHRHCEWTRTFAFIWRRCLYRLFVSDIMKSVMLMHYSCTSTLWMNHTISYIVLNIFNMTYTVVQFALGLYLYCVGIYNICAYPIFNMSILFNSWQTSRTSVSLLFTDVWLKLCTNSHEAYSCHMRRMNYLN